MHAATFNLELKSALRKDETQAIRIRITKFREHAYWNVGRYVLKSEWNKTPRRRLKNWVLKNRMAPQINDAIEVALAGLEEAADKNPGFTAAQIKEAYAKELNPEPEAPEVVPLSFFQYAEEFATRAKETSYNTGLNYGYDLAEFKAVAGEKTPYAELFSERTLHRYLKALKAKGNGPDTIAKKLDTLRKVYNAATKNKRLPLLDHPFGQVKVTVPKKKKARPTPEQVRKFIAHVPTSPKQEMAKTVAMLQYLLQGARIMEALSLPWANVQANHIEYLPQKKAQKPKFVPRSALLNKLLAELPAGPRYYVLPYLGEDYPALPVKKQHYRKKRVIHEVNQGLKEIGEKIGIPFKLESHMFRHAFADALRNTGIDPYTAAAIIGHSNPNTTVGYFKDLALEDISGIALSIMDKLEEKENTGEPLGEQ